jgi:hypothetical protein
MRRVNRQPILTEGMEGYTVPVVHEFVQISAKPILGFGVKVAFRNQNFEKNRRILHRELFYECVKCLVTQKFKGMYQRDICASCKYYICVYNSAQMNNYKLLIDTVVSQIHFPENVSYESNYNKYTRIFENLEKQIRVCRSTNPPNNSSINEVSDVYFNNQTTTLNMINIDSCLMNFIDSRLMNFIVPSHGGIVTAVTSPSRDGRVTDL